MISTRSVGLLIDTVVCLTLAKWETVSGRFGGYLTAPAEWSRWNVSLRLAGLRQRGRRSRPRGECRQEHLWCRWLVAERGMRPDRVVMASPTLDDHLGAAAAHRMSAASGSWLRGTWLHFSILLEYIL